MNIDSIKLDLESKLKLKEVYTKIFKEEKKARETLEKLMKASIDNN
jgi:hypothetical protein